MKPFTRAQREAVKHLYDRSNDKAPSYLSFRRRFSQSLNDCVMGFWCGMFMGIETDGYTHT